LIASQLLLKRVEDVSEEACDADGIYVIMQNQPEVGEGFEVLLNVHLRIMLAIFPALWFVAPFKLVYSLLT